MNKFNVINVLIIEAEIYVTQGYFMFYLYIGLGFGLITINRPFEVAFSIAPLILPTNTLRKLFE